MEEWARCECCMRAYVCDSTVRCGVTRHGGDMYVHIQKHATCLGQKQAGQGPQRREARFPVHEEDEREGDEVDAEERPLRCFSGVCWLNV